MTKLLVILFIIKLYARNILFHIYDNSPAVRLFHVIVIVFSVFMFILEIIAKKYKKKMLTKIQFFILLNLFIANLELY